MKYAIYSILSKSYKKSDKKYYGSALYAIDHIIRHNICNKSITFIKKIKKDHTLKMLILL